MNTRIDSMDRSVQGILYLAGSLGHELNNQLTTVFGCCSSLKRQNADASVLERLQTAAGHMTEKIGSLTGLAGRLGAARRSIVLRDELTRAVACVGRMPLTLPPLNTSLEALEDVQVRMDPAVLPMALSFALEAFAPKTSVLLEGKRTPSGDARMILCGHAADLPEELLASACSSHPAIILGETRRALALAVLKAFVHRCGGQVSWTLGTGSLDATIDLPQVVHVSSFLTE